MKESEKRCLNAEFRMKFNKIFIKVKAKFCCENGNVSQPQKLP
jgi:hypothetical protein